MDRVPRCLAFLIAAALLAVAGGGMVFYFITKQPESFVTQQIIRPVAGILSGFKKFEDVNESAPAFTLAPAELQAAFANDEANAKETYEGKVLLVKGVISSIASPTDTNRVILLEVDGISNISCQMDSRFNNRLKDIAPGNTISIKGICIGSRKDDLLGSLDVLLTRCAVNLPG